MTVFLSSFNAQGAVALRRRDAMLARIVALRALEDRAAQASARSSPVFHKRGQLLPRERVARLLDPKLDMWATAEPVVREWMERNLGPAGRIEGAAEGVSEIGRFIGSVPALLTRTANLVDQLDGHGETQLDADHGDDRECGAGPGGGAHDDQ